MIPTLRLGADVDEARSRIAATVDQLLATTAAPPQLAVVLTGDTLPAPVIAGLITGLRRLRERGGAMTLAAEHDGARAAIRLNGLDRVFALPLVPKEAGESRKRPFAGIGRAAAAGLAAVLALAGVPVNAQDTMLAVPLTDPAAIIAKVVERNPNLSSYQARLHVDVKLQSFPFLRQHLDGSTYYKRPSNYEVVFDRVPSYAKGFEKLYSDVGDPSNWEKRFVVTYVGERQLGNRKDLELRLVQRVRGMIDHETVLIDPGAWTIDEMEYHYYNGGVVTMTQRFETVGSYSMLAAQDATIAIPHVRATAHGTYDGYKTNVAIDDAVFSKKN